jgi:hypothetical protein
MRRALRIYELSFEEFRRQFKRTSAVPDQTADVNSDDADLVTAVAAADTEPRGGPNASAL